MPCGQDLPLRRGRQARTRPSFSRRAWTGPKEGAVRVTKTHGPDGEGQAGARPETRAASLRYATALPLDLLAAGRERGAK
jgi:hypothetical protein